IMTHEIPAPPASPEAFYAFIDTCLAELEAKQATLLARYNMGRQARWWFDPATNQLALYNDPKAKIDLRAQVVVLGSFAPEESTWLWGFANKTLQPAQQAASQPVQALAERFGVEDFKQSEAFEIDPGMAWELAAMACHSLDLLGVYRTSGSLNQHQWFLGLISIEENLPPTQ
ncbi:MAG TPA: hypothetical protein PKE57_12225, partial [Cellvibrionaceae bacterium]|nr:hypothetical protein [Cellvibrionaceae bacterium]